MNLATTFRRLSLGMAMVLGYLGSAEAGIFGVPTNLNANGTTSATSKNPPGWFILERQNSPTMDGDTVHQIRFFIEVTGTTLDIEVFDPGTGPANALGTSGARDLNTASPSTTTRYTLYDPSGAIYNGNGGATEGGPKTINQDITTAGADAITENRLVRFSCNNNATPSWTLANAGTVFGNGAGGCNTMNPGVYIFEVTITDTTPINSINGFGVSFTDLAGNPYNVYTIAKSDNLPAPSANETGWLVGGLNAGGTPANAALPMVFYPYVNRGCSVGASNFDDDLNTVAGVGSNGTITDVLGTATTLTMSNNDDSVQDPITIEGAVGFNLTADNYGLYTVRHNISNVATNQNFVDWRFADFQGFMSNGASGTGGLLPPDGVDALRVYLPNSYSNCNDLAGCTMGTPPAEPIFTSSAAVVSGPNPPVSGSTTSYLISTTLYNPTAQALSDVFAVLPFLAAPVANVATTFVAATDACFVDGVAATCAFTNGVSGTSTWRQAHLTAPATLIAGATFTFQYQINVVVGAAFAGGTIPITPSPAVLGARAPASNCSDNGVANVQRTVNACYTPAFSSPTFDRVETLGPICDMRTDTTTTAKTAARIRGVRRGAGAVEFVAASQRNTRGYEIFDVSNGSPRPLGAVTAISPNSRSPIVYRVPVTGEPSAIEIREQEISGAIRIVGRFETGSPRDTNAVARAVATLERAGSTWISTEGGQALALHSSASFEKLSRHAAINRNGHRRPGPGGPDGLKLNVRGTGQVEVARAELVASGMPEAIATRRLKLWNMGKSVPFEIVRPGAPDEAVRFVPTALRTVYSDYNAYILTWGFRPPRAPAAPFTVEGPALDSTTTTRIEKSIIYLASAPAGADRWLWDQLISNQGSWPPGNDPGAGLFDLPGLVPSTGRVPVTIHLAGMSAHAHTVTATLNGVNVGGVTFEGIATAQINGAIPSELLRPTGNELSLQYSTPTPPNEWGLVYLDAVDLGLTMASGIQAPVSIEAFDQSLPPRKGDYAIVYHGDFADQAAQLAAMKRAHGLAASTVDVQRIYDAYSGGVVEASAIRAYLAEGRKPRFALIFGDDRIDYKNEYGVNDSPFIPSLYANDGELGRVPSENLFADLDGDGAPDLAIGRIPARTSDEAATAVAKISRQNVVAAQRNHLFVTDNQGPADPNFRAHANDVAGALAPGTPVAFADLTDGLGPARSAMTSALAAGAAFTSYFGHGSVEFWADEDLLDANDLTAVAGLKETIVLMWACESQDFVNFYGHSLGEALFFLPAGGAVASVGPAGITDSEAQKSLYSRFYAEMRRPGATLGEALRKAKAALAGDPRFAGLLAGFNLIGDPSLRPQP